MARSDPRAAASAGRDAAVVIATLLVLGLLCGVLWSLLVAPAQFTKLAGGGSMGEDQLGRQFGADGWYVVLAVPAGIGAGGVLSWWRSRDALLTSGVLILGSGVAAAAMELIGHLLGPGNPQAALEVAKVGARVPERLDVDTFVVYLAWPVGVLAGALFVLLVHGPDAEGSRTTREARNSAAQKEPAG